MLREEVLEEDNDYYIVRADVLKGKNMIISKPKKKKAIEKFVKVLEAQNKIAVKEFQIRNIRIEKVTELTYEDKNSLAEDRAIPQKIPSEIFYLEFKKFVKKNENKIKKDFQSIIDPSTGNPAGGKAFLKIESI